ncbi:hypothetical protein GALL_451580 [mine drainage metagenome]|uniref:Uncharacterized protein n=1 Tax=mine drainage metagenome TaxID=410659 RepID=A0A1J5PNQ4_9ZZZZ
MAGARNQIYVAMIFAAKIFGRTLDAVRIFITTDQTPPRAVDSFGQGLEVPQERLIV